VHAMRTTFATLLSKHGVPLRKAQALMRHSDPALTANTYTDARLLDVHGALDVLPALSLDPGDVRSCDGAADHPTASGGNDLVAPTVAAPGGNAGHRVSAHDKASGPDHPPAGAAHVVATVLPDRDKGRLTTPVNPCHSIGAAGFEPTTSRPPV